MTEATMVLVPCQMRSKTERPCTNRAVVKIRGIAFCVPCARQQEAYFTIGELTQETRGLRSKQLAEVLERLRRERTGGRGGVAAEVHHRLPGVNEPERLALTKS